MNLIEMQQEIDSVDLPDVIGTVDRWVRGDEAIWRYERCLEVWGQDFEMYRKSWNRLGSGDRHFGPVEKRIARTALMHDLRDRYIKTFGFMLPCRELLNALSDAKTLVVEIGAGSGYMTKLMRHHGINVIGSDPQSSYSHVLDHGQYDSQQVAAQGKTMVRRYPDALIFCSWPSLDDTWYRQALKAMRIGQRIITVMEDSCAEETAREYFDTCFEIERTIDIPTFEYMNDIVYVAVKKRQTMR